MSSRMGKKLSAMAHWLTVYLSRPAKSSNSPYTNGCAAGSSGLAGRRQPRAFASMRPCSMVKMLRILSLSR